MSERHAHDVRPDDVPDDEGRVVAVVATVMAIVVVGVVAAAAWIAAVGKGWGWGLW